MVALNHPVKTRSQSRRITEIDVGEPVAIDRLPKSFPLDASIARVHHVVLVRTFAQARAHHLAGSELEPKEITGERKRYADQPILEGVLRATI